MTRVTKSASRVAYEEQLGAVLKLDTQIADLDQQIKALAEIRRALADRLNPTDLLDVEVPSVAISTAALGSPAIDRSIATVTSAALNTPPPSMQTHQYVRGSRIGGLLGRLRGGSKR
ncbi:MAG TPA: hypothetical protein VEX68_12895 [Bryobacteraceae bacterium]|nr:hypothetical protein [Bryobacteraceae bacterium]